MREGGSSGYACKCCSIDKLTPRLCCKGVKGGKP